ncbi:TetR/AcrR family transcriptional regulator [Ferrimicrobium sp.]|uniref:TetR/AcrR family transcriptional regulator n=1 Tax=Ferrimicrobium sp. TaxID=2926050 RepID=UPI0026141403|nr:TetR family transcriptional regulator [Ferrimicrobium sp.]
MTTKNASSTRTKLDRNVVVDAALSVADAEGLEAVTIRRLARELAVTPMALYWHFKDKDALLAAIADRMWDETQAALDAAPYVAGTVGIRQVLQALLTVMRRHQPAIAGLMPMRVVECASGLSVTERTLGLFAEWGLDPPRAALLARYLLNSALMLVERQPGVEIVEPVQRTEVQRRKKIALASLPPGLYPNIVAAAAYLTDCDSPEAYFNEGVELVVTGVASQLPDHRPSNASHSS